MECNDGIALGFGLVIIEAMNGLGNSISHHFGSISTP